MSQSISKGRASKFLKRITETAAFKAVIGEKNQRMAYEELVLRYFAFLINGPGTYKSSLPRFLDTTMSWLGDRDESSLLRLEEQFITSLETAHDIFGQNSFRKTLAAPERKKVVNKPLFEVVSVALTSLTSSERNMLLATRASFLEEFKILLKDEQFENAISRSTANKENVDTRFRMFGDLLRRKVAGADLC